MKGYERARLNFAQENMETDWRRSMRMDSTDYQEVLLSLLRSPGKDGCKYTDSSKITPGSM
ncbi:hypothetical protein ANCDUO_06819 [Ancylostoma duodenale]|uniref:Uncharacterized protein n=1 Tax=Ancylostoma duodenale TaxID=51022 RepID=A0A0C2DK65_9BILA|nr:hypothetical protein ANCDUO_06819 [Ancylostoma duodenale]